jgi:hypothetical protein
MTFGLFIPLVVALVFAGCKKDSSSPTGPGTGGNGGGTGTFTFTMDGTNYSGVGVAVVDTTTTGRPAVVGTYISTTNPKITVALSVAASETFPENTDVSLTGGTAYGIVLLGEPTAPTAMYSTQLPGASGTMKVTSVTATNVIGTFTFTATSTTGTGQKAITNGTFNAVLQYGG